MLYNNFSLRFGPDKCDVKAHSQASIYPDVARALGFIEDSDDGRADRVVELKLQEAERRKQEYHHFRMASRIYGTDEWFVMNRW